MHVNKLIKCEHCDSQISDTALRFPICGKDTGSKESLSKKIGLSTAGATAVLLSGPAGIAAVMLGSIFDFSSNRHLKKISKKVGAIDSFNLTNDILILVNDTQFIIILTSTAGPTEFTGFLRSDIHHVYIDEDKSKKGGFLSNEKTVLYLAYLDYYTKEVVRDDYIFKGKNSRIKAEFVLAKLLEYKSPANMALKTDG